MGHQITFNFLTSFYQKTSASTLKFGNKLWTTKELFSAINDTYLQSLDEKYKTGFSFLQDQEPEKAVNEWISDVTNKKINKLYGNENQ